MIIRIVDDSISLDELREIAKEYYIDMIKGVADISKERGKVIDFLKYKERISDLFSKDGNNCCWRGISYGC